MLCARCGHEDGVCHPNCPAGFEVQNLQLSGRVLSGLRFIESEPLGDTDMFVDPQLRAGNAAILDGSELRASAFLDIDVLPA